MIPGGVGDTQMMSGTDPAVFQSVGLSGHWAVSGSGHYECGTILVTAPTVKRPELAVDHGWTVA